MAVDIGTTTIAVQLIDLDGRPNPRDASDYNAQIACGLDVISRINYARDPDAPGGTPHARARHDQPPDSPVARQPRRRPRRDLQCGRLRQHRHDPPAAGLESRNTSASHPYTPTVLQVAVPARPEIGIDINPQAWVYFSPCVGSYVGGDITAGVLCTDLAPRREQINLFIDIGTNGEIVVGNRDFLMTCACSAGPAFEGGGIDCGMRASDRRHREGRD